MKGVGFVRASIATYIGQLADRYERDAALPGSQPPPSPQVTLRALQSSIVAGLDRTEPPPPAPEG